MILHHFGPEKCQKSDPERHEFWERHNSLLLWARESPKSNHETHKFWETALIDPSKNANKKYSFFQNFTLYLKLQGSPAHNSVELLLFVWFTISFTIVPEVSIALVMH